MQGSEYVYMGFSTSEADISNPTHKRIPRVCVSGLSMKLMARPRGCPATWKAN
jgi:hypothetical protein